MITQEMLLDLRRLVELPVTETAPEHTRNIRSVSVATLTDLLDTIDHLREVEGAFNIALESIEFQRVMESVDHELKIAEKNTVDPPMLTHPIEVFPVKGNLLGEFPLPPRPVLFADRINRLHLQACRNPIVLEDIEYTLAGDMINQPKCMVVITELTDGYTYTYHLTTETGTFVGVPVLLPYDTERENISLTMSGQESTGLVIPEEPIIANSLIISHDLNGVGLDPLRNDMVDKPLHRNADLQAMLEAASGNEESK